MALIKEHTNGEITYPYSLKDAKKEFKHISFPVSFPQTGDPDLGIFPVMTTPPPANAQTHVFHETEPEKVDGVYYQTWSDPVEKDPEDLEALRQNIRSRVKAEAGRRILDRLPDWKQRNFLAHSLEIQDKIQAGDTPSQEDLAIKAFAEQEWAWAKAVRAESDALEATLDSMDVLEAMQYDIQNHNGWPS